MWSFLYQVLASVAALLKQQQTGQLSSPGITCTFTQCSPRYVQYVSEFYFIYLGKGNVNSVCLYMIKVLWNQATNCITGVPQCAIIRSVVSEEPNHWLNLP